MKISKVPLSKSHPHLMGEWDFEKNEIRPEEVTYGSGKKVWWVCSKKGCAHNWKTAVSKRTCKDPRGCPVCAREKRAKSHIKTIINKNGSLYSRFTKVSKEWHPTKNGNLKPEEFAAASNKEVWWLCPTQECGHVWITPICMRTGKVPTSCPACSGSVATIKNNLKTKFPEPAKEWHPTKNGDLNPRGLLPFSNKKVWWKCSECKHEWKAFVYNRTCYSRGCPACANQVVTDKNNLAIMFSEVAKDWDFDKNKMGPENVVFGSNKKVWWKCHKCRHSWKTVIRSRTVGNHGCSICNRGPVSKRSQKWLDALNIPNEYREFSIKNLGIKVDAYNPETNTVYEFLGDYWHGNPNNSKYPMEEINSHNKKSFGKLYQETLDRIKLLKENGYKVTYIWESDFRLK